MLDVKGMVYFSYGVVFMNHNPEGSESDFRLQGGYNLGKLGSFCTSAKRKTKFIPINRVSRRKLIRSPMTSMSSLGSIKSLSGSSGAIYARKKTKQNIGLICLNQDMSYLLQIFN